MLIHDIEYDADYKSEICNLRQKHMQWLTLASITPYEMYIGFLVFQLWVSALWCFELIHEIFDESEDDCV